MLFMKQVLPRLARPDIFRGTKGEYTEKFRALVASAKLHVEEYVHARSFVGGGGTRDLAVGTLDTQ